jgi:Kef-type K+ transport system membrane component KefB
VFFVTIGMKVQPAKLNPFADNAQFGLALLLTLVAVVSKLVAGVVIYQPGVRRWPESRQQRTIYSGGLPSLGKRR